MSDHKHPHDHEHSHGHDHDHNHDEHEHTHSHSCGHDHDHDHGHSCDHNHSHDEQRSEHHHDHGESCGHHHAHNHQKESGIKGIFKRSAAWIKNNQRPLVLGASALLATTALTTVVPSGIIPLLALGAGGLYLMHKASDYALVDFESFGEKRGMSAMSLGIMTGVIHSASEAVVSFSALADGAPELALSNIVGGSIVHTLGILGATAAIAGIGDKHSDRVGWKFNSAVMAAGTGALGAQLMGGELIPGLGLGMAGFGLYHLYKRVKGGEGCSHDHGDGHSCGHNHDHEHEHEHSHSHSACGHDHTHDKSPKSRPAWVDGASAVLSLGALIAVSDVVVSNILELSDQSGISHTVAGIGIAAIGTALPEAIMTIKAAMKKKTGFALGNVMGCNITNTLLVGGAIGAISGLDHLGVDLADHLSNIQVPESLRPTNVEGMLNWGAFIGSSALAVGVLSAQGGKIKRWQGVTAAALYAAYLTTMTQVSDNPLLHCHFHTSGELHCANDNSELNDMEFEFSIEDLEEENGVPVIELE